MVKKFFSLFSETYLNSFTYNMFRNTEKIFRGGKNEAFIKIGRIGIACSLAAAG